jgi:hypothetical protein
VVCTGQPERLGTAEEGLLLVTHRRGHHGMVASTQSKYGTISAVA